MVRRFLSVLSVMGLIWLVSGSAPVAWAEDGAAGFTVTAIDVDVAAKTAQAARDGAFREAQRRAWPVLWARMTGQPAPQAPHLGDSALDAIVAAIEIQNESFSDKRYIGRLAVVFDRQRTARYLGGEAAVLQSAPMLLMPLLIDGGALVSYDYTSPWLAAWRRLRAGVSPIDYVRAPSGAGDAMLLNGWQARRDDRTMWRTILTRYGAENVLTAQVQLVRSYPGGPVRGVFEARHGPDAKLLSRFQLKVKSTAEIDRLMDEGVRRIDEAYAGALRAGLLKGDPALSVELDTTLLRTPKLAVVETPDNGLLLTISTPDAAALAQAEALLRGTPTVSNAALASLALGGNSQFRLSLGSTREWLVWHLDQRGWRLLETAQGWYLRRRLPSDPRAPKPLPVPVPGQATATPVAKSGATAGGPRDLMPAGVD